MRWLSVWILSIVFVFLHRVIFNGQCMQFGHLFISYDCFVKIYSNICPLSFHVPLQHPTGMPGHIVFWFQKLLLLVIVHPTLEYVRKSKKERKRKVFILFNCFFSGRWNFNGILVSAHSMNRICSKWSKSKYIVGQCFSQLNNLYATTKWMNLTKE